MYKKAHSGWGGARAGAGRPRKPICLATLSRQVDDPLEFLGLVMNASDVPVEVRVAAARALLPYLSERSAPAERPGKKEQAAARAQSTSETTAKYKPGAPPARLVVNNSAFGAK